jgi:hypothetical protein
MLPGVKQAAEPTNTSHNPSVTLPEHRACMKPQATIQVEALYTTRPCCMFICPGRITVASCLHTSRCSWASSRRALTQSSVLQSSFIHKITQSWASHEGAPHKSMQLGITRKSPYLYTLCCSWALQRRALTQSVAAGLYTDVPSHCGTQAASCSALRFTQRCPHTSWCTGRHPEPGTPAG